jgi:hypothetical protein
VERIQIISALFKWDGSRIYGDEKIIITKHSAEDDSWFYSVNELENYVFIRIPTNASCVIEKPGQYLEIKMRIQNTLDMWQFPTGVFMVTLYLM